MLRPMTERADPEEGQVTDPVCGMQVEPSSAAAAWEHEGTTYLFCSVACMRRFRTDPAHYLSLSDDERHM
jgi:P-type Cu+ transporter